MEGSIKYMGPGSVGVGPHGAGGGFISGDTALTFEARFVSDYLTGRPRRDGRVTTSGACLTGCGGSLLVRLDGV